jgi:hypothetical protein
MIPAFDSDGNLPAGIHFVIWTEFETRFVVNPHRRLLFEGLQSASAILKSVGCRTIYVDGSFVTAKEYPNDFDVAWDHAFVDLHRLIQLEPIFFDFGNQRATQKAKFRGEFFPSSSRADRAGTAFLEFFQIDKSTGKPKGIIGISL